MKENITSFSTTALKIHPRNTEFFDDISGKEYEQFKQSIQEDGVITPLIASNDMTLISGHQRLKACLDLEIKTVPVIIREDLDNEDEKLKVLLAANFGRSKNDEAKQRKIAAEYVKLCGLRNGEKLCDNRTALSLDQIAIHLGTSKRTLQELLEIERKLTPELKEILNSGGITKTTASKILVRLSKEDQQALLSDLGKDQLAAMTQAQVQEHINKIKELENVVDGYKLKLESRDSEISKAITTTKEELTEKITKLTAEKESLERKVKLNQEDSDKYTKLKKDIEFLTKEKSDLAIRLEKSTQLADLVVRLQNVLETELAPIKYKQCMEVLNDNDIAKQNLTDVVNSVANWLHEMQGYLPQSDYINAEYTEIDN